MDDLRGYILGPPHRITPTAVTTNENIKLSSFKIHRKESGPDSTVSNNQLSTVTLNELATNAKGKREHTIVSSFREAVNPKID